MVAVSLFPDEQEVHDDARMYDVGQNQNDAQENNSWFVTQQNARETDDEQQKIYRPVNVRTMCSPLLLNYNTSSPLSLIP